MLWRAGAVDLLDAGERVGTFAAAGRHHEVAGAVVGDAGGADRGGIGRGVDPAAADDGVVVGAAAERVVAGAAAQHVGEEGAGRRVVAGAAVPVEGTVDQAGAGRGHVAYDFDASNGIGEVVAGKECDVRPIFDPGDAAGTRVAGGDTGSAVGHDIAAEGGVRAETEIGRHQEGRRGRAVRQGDAEITGYGVVEHLENGPATGLGRILDPVAGALAGIGVALELAGDSRVAEVSPDPLDVGEGRVEHVDITVAADRDAGSDIGGVFDVGKVHVLDRADAQMADGLRHLLTGAIDLEVREVGGDAGVDQDQASAVGVVVAAGVEVGMQSRGAHPGAVDRNVLADRDLGAANVHVARREADGEGSAGMGVGGVDRRLEIVERADQVVRRVEQLRRLREVERDVVARHTRRAVLEYESLDAGEAVAALIEAHNGGLGYLREAGDEAVSVGRGGVGVVGETIGIDRGVGAGAAADGVATGAADEGVVVGPAAQRVIAGAGVDVIVPAETRQRVGGGGAKQLVVAFRCAEGDRRCSRRLREQHDIGGIVGVDVAGVRKHRGFGAVRGIVVAEPDVEGRDGVVLHDSAVGIEQEDAVVLVVRVGAEGRVARHGIVGDLDRAAVEDQNAGGAAREGVGRRGIVVSDVGDRVVVDRGLVPAKSPSPTRRQRADLDGVLRLAWRSASRRWLLSWMLTVSVAPLTKMPVFWKSLTVEFSMVDGVRAGAAMRDVVAGREDGMVALVAGDVRADQLVGTLATATPSMMGVGIEHVDAQEVMVRARDIV